MKANVNKMTKEIETFLCDPLRTTTVVGFRSFYKNDLNNNLRKMSLAVVPLLLSACNSERQKLLGNLGDGVINALESLTNESQPVSTAYTINSTVPLEIHGDGTSSEEIEVTGAVVASPIISGHPLIDFTFSAAGTVDFANVTDVKNVSISTSTAGASFTNLSTDIEKVIVTETQSGDWAISFKPNSFATLYFDWTNNTGVSVDLTSLTLNEVGQLAFKNSGQEPITIPLLNLDPDDTQRIEIGNDNDGDIIFSSATNLNGTTALKTMKLSTWNDGDIILGTPGVSGFPDLKELTSIAIEASSTGAITIGDLGTTTAIDNISSIAMTTQGAPINIGSINAKKINNIIASGEEFSSINIGNITIDETILDFTLGGASEITLGAFSGEGTVSLDASGMSKKGIMLDFSALKGSVDVTTTSHDDIVSLGVGAGKVICGAGDDTITVIANAIGNADIRCGDGVDIITLSSQSGTDLVEPGGTSVSTIIGSATDHATIICDKIINFDPNSDTIGFGSTTANETNFLSETDATSFSNALSKANTAMGSGKTYYLSYNVASATDGYGLLFYDSDGNGTGDTCISLVGIITDTFTYENLVIV